MNNTYEMKRKWEAILDFASLFLLFMVGSVLGFILEGIWHRIKLGIWESHSALVWGPFCIIYGIGAAAVYLLSCCLWKKHIFLQFLAFSFSGAVVEYFSGLLQEIKLCGFLDKKRRLPDLNVIETVAFTFHF